MENGNIQKKTFKEKSTFKKTNNIPLYELFHRNSEINSLNAYNFSDIISNAILDKDFINECLTPKSLHKEKETIELPSPNSQLNTLNLFDVISKRRSVRNFSKEPITLEELSTILFYSSGVTGEYSETKDKPHMYLFAYPSAGRLMPLDSYVFINNVKDIASGIYYYDPIRHFLKVIKKDFQPNNFKELTLSYSLSEKAAFVIYILGTINLTGYKYGDRGYRFMLLEAGHLAQNLYLVSTAIGAGAVASGGFLDGEIIDILDLDKADTFVLYEVIIGKPNTETDYRFMP